MIESGDEVAGAETDAIEEEVVRVVPPVPSEEVEGDMKPADRVVAESLELFRGALFVGAMLYVESARGVASHPVVEDVVASATGEHGEVATEVANVVLEEDAPT